MIEVWLHSFLNSTTDEGKWSTAGLGRFARKKESRHTLDKSICGPQGRCGYFGIEKNCLFTAGIRTRQPQARSLVTVPTSLSQFPQKFPQM